MWVTARGCGTGGTRLRHGARRPGPMRHHGLGGKQSHRGAGGGSGFLPPPRSPPPRGGGGACCRRLKMRAACWVWDAAGVVAVRWRARRQLGGWVWLMVRWKEDEQGLGGWRRRLERQLLTGAGTTGLAVAWDGNGMGEAGWKGLLGRICEVGKAGGRGRGDGLPGTGDLACRSPVAWAGAAPGRAVSESGGPCGGGCGRGYKAACRRLDATARRAGARLSPDQGENTMCCRATARRWATLRGGSMRCCAHARSGVRLRACPNRGRFRSGPGRQQGAWAQRCE